ncbi:LysR family transcriptional regulator [Agrococcus sp. ARC_14]|uniref:LysR family transcriptional regulator n=1 Tax=Agrococcus sp. ARC_14 TaxID=2919927 RepID=UPI001F062998|nr:LysR family transcriptional regulator [Agrococcus sp. ARC_14]MCH1884153.1 LysR family transcriptional regulator [Agrococcus sp. ARC_14]
MLSDPRDPRLLRDLPVLVALRRTGSVTGAADELGIPQPTATRALQRIASIVGAPIVHREGRGVALTPAGAGLADAGETALQAIGDALATASRARSIDAAELGLAFQTMLGESFVPEAIRRFRSRWPTVSFRLQHGARARCIDAILDGTADIALVASPPAGHGSVTMLYAEPLVAVVAASHPVAAMREVTVDALRAWPQIMLAPGFGVHDAVELLFAAEGTVPEPTLVVGDYRAARGMAAAGLGVAVLPPSPAFIDDGAREIPVRHPLARREIGAMVADDRDPAVQELLRAFVDTAARRATALS